MYIPSAMALTGGGYFIRRPDSAVWDTPLSAQHILKGMLDVHGAQLKALPQRLAPAGSSPSGGTLQDYCVAGLATDNAQSAVECVLRLKEELCSLPGDQQRVLFVVDNYNALYHTTQYGTLAEPASERRRRALNVEELSLASGMRLLVQDCGQAAVVAGLTLGTHMSSRLRIPAIGCAAYAIPRYSAIETAHALHYMWEVGRAPVAPSQEQVDKVLALSNGNGREVTSLALSLSMLDINLA